MSIIDTNSSFVEDILSAAGIGPVLEITGDFQSVYPKLRAKGVRATPMSLEVFLQASFKSDEIPHTLVTFHALDHIDEITLSRFIARVRELGINNVVAKVGFDTSGATPQCRPRYWWETRFVEGGFRKNPRYFNVISYADLEWEGHAGTLLMQLVSKASLDRYPYEKLLAERSLHMDMARESGRRSEGHMVRYDYAASLIRPGDVVVDVACGLGYGSATLAACSLASKVIGIDLDDFAVDYASLTYANSRLEFRKASAAELNCIPNQSVDFFCSFETLEHVDDPEAVLKEAARILKPSGRVMVSVPNQWVDETGRDPNPYHLHVYDRYRLTQELSKYFLLDEVIGQTAGGGFKCHDGLRRIWSIKHLEGSGHANEAEWILATGMKDPIANSDIPYVETSYPDYNAIEGFNVLALKRDYNNPWLYKALFSTPWRLKSSDSLLRLGDLALRQQSDRKTDAAAALAVIGYQLLEKESSDEYKAFIDESHSILKQLKNDPIDVRWKVSLKYLEAQMHLISGRYADAERVLQDVVEFDAVEFSPLLCIKNCNAWFLLGVMAYQRGDDAAARNCWESGLQYAKEGIIGDWLNVIGTVSQPLTFGMPEISLLADIGARCAFALANSERGLSDLGLFYTSTTRDWTSIREADRIAIETLNRLADERLKEIGRLARDRQELFDVAEQRLSELQRLGNERQELYNVAEERLVELQKLVRECDALKQKLYSFNGHKKWYEL
ncbi:MULTISPECIES: class I SAM-dependent methyltransferase [unclassified Brucella]|uniref:class I SAM-dependent methyltransferase n=1 Tax=unclassified Brucella TaxID=2632610 RepID=UPI0009727756|nr:MULTISPECIES: class I SAM-dependent methyltransferase [unclassified Brucella]APX69368.1 hypothetical protein BKD03_08150 [Brucella sp. 09RB8471]MRN79862.1 methyltransferase domain-containing protein [Brucella sp. 10RB9210]